VWLGHDDALAAPVAIKVLSGSLLDDLDVRNRFLEEARILRRADSERLVRVHDIGELPDGRPYFVMSYADRGTLSDRMRARPLGIKETLALAEEIANGVEVINRLGVIHRDLKPSNVLFQSTPDGGERLLIADLGLAKAIAHASGAFTLPVGTPGYMSPEQARFGGGLDVRADVYGLGALTYHMLTGKPPGPAPVRIKPSELRMELPPGTDEVILRAMEVDREKRYPTAESFARALAGLRWPGGAERASSGPPSYSSRAPVTVDDGRLGDPSAHQDRSAGMGIPGPPRNAVWSTPVASEEPPEDEAERTVRDRPSQADPIDDDDDRTVRDRPRGSAPADDDHTIAVARDQSHRPGQRSPGPREGAGGAPPRYGGPGQQGGPGQHGGPGQYGGPGGWYGEPGSGPYERAEGYGGPPPGRPGQYGGPGGPYGGPGRQGGYVGQATPPVGSGQPDWQGGGTGPARDGKGKGRKRLLALVIAVVLLLLALAGGLLLMNRLGSDGKKARPQPTPTVPPDFAVVGDASGKIRAAVPKAWRKLDTPPTWKPSGVDLTDSAARPVLRATSGSFQQFLDPTAKVPGVFIGLTSDVAQGKLPPARAAAHAQCTQAPPQSYTTPDKALTGTVTRYTGCRTGVPTITEIGLTDRSGKFGVWVRVKEVDDRGAATDILNNLKLTGP
jgi:serine/threonine protein kinase